MRSPLTIFLCLVLTVSTVYVQAQSFKVNGKVIESQKKMGLDYASVSLIRLPDSAIMDTQFTNEQGMYGFKDVKPGTYLVASYFVGYEKGKSDAFEVLAADINVPVLTLVADTKILKEVTIKGNKPLVERKVDRMVFNLENAIAAKGTDLSQALAITPMLKVGENGISIVGKGGVSVMINEKMVQLRGNDLMNFLKSLRSDDIERIEVITTPPAKYEAQGNSGIINLVVKSNPNLGWSGNFSPSYMQNTYASYANNLNLNYQSNRLSSSFKFRQYNRLSHIEEQTNNIGFNSILSADPRKNNSKGMGGNFSLDYKAGKKANIGIVYDLSKTGSDVDINNRTIYQTNNLTDSVLSTISHNKNPNLTQTLNVYYDQKLDTSGKKLSAGFDFFNTQPETINNFQTTSNQTSTISTVKNYSGTKNKIWSIQADLVLPYKWAGLETGIKFTNFDNNSDVDYYNLIENIYQADPSKSNLFEYNEKNIGGYISGQKDLNKFWSVKAGLRYEYTLVEGYSPKTNSNNQSAYGKLFPTVYLSYKPDEKNTFSVNYSKRINRPNLRAINPAKWYSNPYSYFTGNPFLKPSYNHNVELSYLRGSLYVTLYGQRIVDGYGYILEIKDAFKIVNAYNYLNQQNAGLVVGLNRKFLPWWENSSSVVYSYSSSNSILPQVVTGSGSAFYYDVNNTFKTSKQTSAFVNFRHSLASRESNIYIEGQYALSAGVRASFAENKFQMNVSLNDILKSDRSRNRLYYADVVQYTDTYYDSRFLNLNFTYTFGKLKVKGNQKQINFRETQRAN